MARTTTIITSIIKGGKSVENVTVDSTSWSTDNGTITLSATVPSTVQIGDTITDNSTNTYLITGISGADLTAQDFDTTTDPTTGSATIQEAYQTITTWEADLDVSTLYASGDNAIGECYKSGGAFDESVTINGGGTIGLNSIKLTVASGERHDGTAGTGMRFLLSANGSTFITTSSSSPKTTIEWIEFNANGYQVSSYGIYANSFSANLTIKQCIIHDFANGSPSPTGIYIGNSGVADPSIINNIIYNINKISGSGTSYGINTNYFSGGICYILNNTVQKITADGSADTGGIKVRDSSPVHSVKNNISCDSNLGATSGTEEDYIPASPTNAVMQYNLSSDTTASGTGSLTSKSSANQFVSTTGGSEDLHLKTGADAIDAGTDLGTSPTGVNISIATSGYANGYDRDTDPDGRASTWDMGADEFGATATGSPTLLRKDILRTGFQRIGRGI